MNLSIIDKVIEQLKAMPQPLQWQILEFAKKLVNSEIRGTPGKQLLHLAGSIATDDLQLMREAIEGGCD